MTMPEGECRFVPDDECERHGSPWDLCSVAAAALRRSVETHKENCKVLTEDRDELLVKVVDLESGLIRMCPPGTCKVQAPNECTCIVVVSELKARLAQAEAQAAEAGAKYTSCLDAAAELQSLLVTRDAEVGALTNLVNRLEFVHNSEEYKNVWWLYATHSIGGYRGPTYEEALNEAKAALASSGGRAHEEMYGWKIVPPPDVGSHYTETPHP